MLTVVLRNFAVEILFYAFWHWFLYSATSPGAHRMKPQKFNPINPYAHMCTLCSLQFSTLTRTVAPHRYEDNSRAHLPREVLFTTLGFCMSSAFEIGMMHAWATGTVRVLASRLACCPSLHLSLLSFLTMLVQGLSPCMPTFGPSRSGLWQTFWSSPTGGMLTFGSSIGIRFERHTHIHLFVQTRQ